MKVSKQFFCTQESKNYEPGDEYTGKRKDLGSFLEAPKKSTASHQQKVADKTQKKATPKKKK